MLVVAVNRTNTELLKRTVLLPSSLPSLELSSQANKNSGEAENGGVGLDFASVYLFFDVHLYERNMLCVGSRGTTFSSGSQ